MRKCTVYGVSTSVHIICYCSAITCMSHEQYTLLYLVIIYNGLVHEWDVVKAILCLTEVLNCSKTLERT